MVNCIFEEDSDIIAAEVGRRIQVVAKSSRFAKREKDKGSVERICIYRRIVGGERPEDHRRTKQTLDDSSKIIIHLDLVTTGGAACCKGVTMMGVERRKEIAIAGDRRKLFEELDTKTKATMLDIRKRMRIDGDEEDGQHLSKKRV